MPLHPNMEPSDFLEILRRRRWLVVFSFLLILFGAMVYCVLVPDQYRSSAKILIIPPAVAEGVVRSTVNLSTRDRLNAITQDILSRPRLLGVIHGIGVSKLGFEGMSESAMLAKMRNDVELGIDGNKGRSKDRDVNTFVLSFYHVSPKIAQEVSSSLSSLFIGENIKLREMVTQETTMFLDTQLEETRRRLEQQEDKIKQYKLQFGGELPQQETSNLNRIQRLSDQIKGNSDSIARLQDRKLFLESQISAMLRARELPDSTASEDLYVPSSLLADLASRRRKLEEATRKYTSIHPAVVQARWELEQAEAKVADARKAAQMAGPPGSPEPEPENAEIKRLRMQVSQTDLEITALKRESAGKSALIDEIQRKVERLPQREQEIISLTRDYDNIKKSYDELLDKKLKATISRNLEENQKGERFQVLEPADLPTRPAKPDRLQAMGIAMLLFLAVGIGGAFGLEVLDPTLRGSKDFKSFFEVPILASLPVIQNDEYRRQTTLRSIAIKGGLLSIAGAYGVFILLKGEKILSIVHSIAAGFGGKN